MELEELADGSNDLLKNALRRVKSQSSGGDVASNFRRKFILTHARQIQDLAEDVLDLEDRNRTQSSQLLVRGMIENLFILGAAVREPSFAGEKVIYDMEQTAKYAKNDAEKASPQALKGYLQDQAKESTERARELRERHGITGKLSWRPSDCAEKSGLFRHYAVDYAIYSAPTHGELISVILAQGNRSSVHLFRTLTFICLEAVRFVLQAFGSDTVAQLEEQRKGLFDRLAKLESEGKLMPLYLKDLSGELTIARNRKTGGPQKH